MLQYTMETSIQNPGKPLRERAKSLNTRPYTIYMEPPTGGSIE